MTEEEKREKRNAYMREYRKSHKAEIALTQRKKYIKYRDRLIKYQAEYRRKKNENGYD